MRPPRLLLLLLVLLLKSCEVPDVQPFIGATAEMGKNIDAGLKQVVADLKKVVILDTLAGAPAPEQPARQQQQRTLREYQATLARQARAFTAVATAFDAYAQALGDVVARGERAGKRIDKVSAALSGLLKAAGDFATVPGGKLPAAATTFLTGFAKEYRQGVTIRQLSDLASPAQDTAVQQTARALRLGLQAFSSIDSAAYVLLDNYKPEYSEWLADLYRNDLGRQRQAVQRLQLISQLRSFRLSAKPALLSGRLRELRKLDSLAGSQLVAAAAQSWRRVTDAQGVPLAGFNGQPVTAAYATRRDAALRQVDAALDARETYYLGWLMPPQVAALYAGTRAGQPQPVPWVAGGPQPDPWVAGGPQPQPWFEASQRAVAKWASTHQLLRQALVKAKKVSAADYVRYGQATKDFVVAVREIQK